MKRNEDKKKLITITLISFLIMLLLMTIYEIIKEFVFEDLTLWESHTITIIFSSLIATIISYFTTKYLLNINKENRDLKEELIIKNKNLLEINSKYEYENKEKNKTKYNLIKTSVKLKKILENSFDIINILDENGVILFENYATKRVLGFEPGKRIGKVIVDFVHPDHKKKVSENFAQLVMTPNEIKVMKFLFQHEDGTWRWLEANAQNFLNDENINGIIINSRDITDIKKFEHDNSMNRLELRKQLNFTKALMKAIPNPMFYKNSVGLYLGCNSAFESFTGKTADDILNKTVFELWPSELSKEYHKRDLELINNPTHQRYEFDVKNINGEYRKVIFDKAVFFDENNIPAGIIGIYSDITELKKKDEKFILTKTRIKSLIKAIPNNIVKIDNNCKILDFKCEDEENIFSIDNIGNHLSEIVDDGFEKIVKQYIEQAQKYNSMQKFNYKYFNNFEDEISIDIRMTSLNENELLLIIRKI